MANVIEKLTPEQEAMIPVMRDRWLKKGHDTTPITLDKAWPIIRNLCKDSLKIPVPENLVLMDGPVVAWPLVVALQAEPKGVVAPKRLEQLKEEAICTGKAALGGNTKVTKSIPGFVWPYLDGQFSAGVLAFYAYMNEVLKIELVPEFAAYAATVDLSLMYVIRDDVWVLVDKPSTISLNENLVPHCDGGPAIAYRDGLKVWALNGVQVPQWLAETPHHKMDPLAFAKIDNVEVRREFVRKFGVERMLTALKAKRVDKQGDYELYLVNLGGRTGEWPYLKMLNPSIGIWHVEAVAKTCRTVAEAIEFRNKSNITPEIVT